MTRSSSRPALKRFVEIGDGFFHLRSTFRVGWLFDIGTQMALCRLSNGHFLVLDTVKLSDEEKHYVDTLTANGTMIDAVIATHPFHTSGFGDFYKMYPGAKYYGTPRHLRLCSSIPWAGSLNDASVRNQWDEFGVQLRIPDGCEFINPQPESYNHFCNVFAYHAKSRTVYNDDTLVYWTGSYWNPMSWVTKGGVRFHPTLTNVGLYPTKDAPLAFKKWMVQLLEDWNFDNLCTAHNENIIGGAKDAVRKLLEETEGVFNDMAAKNAAKEGQAISIGG
jgi:hypothetical protein